MKKDELSHNLSEKEFFISACFADDLQLFYKQWIEKGKKNGRIQFFEARDDGLLIHKYWKPSNICCETGEKLTKDDIDVKVGYWTPYIWKPVKKDVKQYSAMKEIVECQKIDCSCNDCLYLNRSEKKCDLFNNQIQINVNTCEVNNQKCFKHRKE